MQGQEVKKTRQCGRPTSSMEYTLKDIAEYIGIDYATVSRTIRKIEGEYEK